MYGSVRPFLPITVGDMRGIISQFIILRSNAKSIDLGVFFVVAFHRYRNNPTVLKCRSIWPPCFLCPSIILMVAGLLGFIAYHYAAMPQAMQTPSCCRFHLHLRSSKVRFFVSQEPPVVAKLASNSTPQDSHRYCRQPELV